MNHDALCWDFGLAWVLFSFSQVHGSLAAYFGSFSAEKLG